MSLQLSWNAHCIATPKRGSADDLPSSLMKAAANTSSASRKRGGTSPTGLDWSQCRHASLSVTATRSLVVATVSQPLGDPICGGDQVRAKRIHQRRQRDHRRVGVHPNGCNHLTGVRTDRRGDRIQAECQLFLGGGKALLTDALYLCSQRLLVIVFGRRCSWSGRCVSGFAVAVAVLDELKSSPTALLSASCCSPCASSSK